MQFIFYACLYVNVSNCPTKAPSYISFVLYHRKPILSTTTQQDIFDYCFGQAPFDLVTTEELIDRWFNPEHDPNFDEDLRKRFGNAVAASRRGVMDSWASTARGSLALIMLFDQLPRNIYRGTKGAFASDHRALETTTVGIKRGFAEELNLVERIFFFIPLEHAEDIRVQDECVKQFKALDKIAPSEMKSITQACMQENAAHREVIRRFGRFPQRNAALGRTSTGEELEWLAEHHGWGQK